MNLDPRDVVLNPCKAKLDTPIANPTTARAPLRIGVAIIENDGAILHPRRMI